MCRDSELTDFVIIDNWDGEGKKFTRESAGFQKIKQWCIDQQEVEIWNKRQKGHTIWLLAKNKNLGYAKANNLGILFNESFIHAQYAIFSNNDIQWKERFSLKSLERVFDEHPDCFVVGPEIVGLDGKRQGPVIKKRDQWFRDLICPYSLFRLWISDGVKYPNKKFKFGIVHHVSGAFMMTKIELFKKIKMFDENTFLYNEEDILSERGKTKNLKCYFDASITIIHEGGATTSRNLSTLRQQRIGFESAIYYYEFYCNTNRALLLISKFNFYFLFTPLLYAMERIYKGWNDYAR